MGGDMISGFVPDYGAGLFDDMMGSGKQGYLGSGDSFGGSGFENIFGKDNMMNSLFNKDTLNMMLQGYGAYKGGQVADMNMTKMQQDMARKKKEDKMYDKFASSWSGGGGTNKSSVPSSGFAANTPAPVTL